MARNINLRTLAGAIFCAGFAFSAAVAQTTRLSPEEARVAAWRALQAGQPQITLNLANALVKRSPDAYEPTFLRAEALRFLKRNEEAARAARMAYRKAKISAHKFDAAHSAAKSHFAKGTKGQAQLWLRRAQHHAPNDYAKQVAVQDFRFVRRANPLKTTIDFGIFPTSNINNGSTNDEITILGLPFRVPATGQPHSGTGVRFGLHTVYSKAVSEKRVLRFGLKGSTTQYKLSSSAKALGSGLTGSDFAYTSAEVQTGMTFLRPEFKGGGWGTTRIDAALGRSWYGGSSLSNFGRVSVGQDYGINPSRLLRTKFGVEQQNRLDDDTASATIASFDLTMINALKTGGRMSYGVSVVNSSSDNNVVETDVMRAHVTYTTKPWKMGVIPTFSLSAEQTEYPKLFIGGVNRKDRRTSASASFFFTSIGYFGFSPTVTVAATENKSSVSIYSTKNLSMNFGIRSSF